MKTTYTKFILLLAATTFIACNEEKAPSLHISASADKTEVKVGEPVTFSIRHNAMAVSIYTGDDGHDYKSSAYYLLQGKTNDDLQNNQLSALSIRKLHRIIVTLRYTRRFHFHYGQSRRSCERRQW